MVARIQNGDMATNGRYIVRTLAEVASFFGVEEATVRVGWRCRADMPGTPGRYDLAAIAKWKLARSSAPESSSLRTERLQAEVDLLRERCRKLQMTNDRVSGQTTDTAEVTREFAMWMTRIADRLQALPDEIETELPTEVRAEVKTRIANLIALVLKEMSQWQI